MVKTVFVCENCRYKFTSEKDATKKKCPYCDHQNTVSIQKSAQEILDLNLD